MGGSSVERVEYPFMTSVEIETENWRELESKILISSCNPTSKGV